MILNGEELELIDASEKITIADSFVHPSQKLETEKDANSNIDHQTDTG